MPAVKGRRHRTGVSNTVELMVRVHPDRRDKARAAAGALGISVAAYIDELLARERLDAQGRPVWWTDPVLQDQEVLPLQTT